ncbi:MotA/TolQ/ExbB proton channel family protein [Arenibaculum pallidiluteum]|uniref:MotA/TolQ/ExbB proton channel family protein n=1 Tax=Arenibaculum pallidiluteum TaxID=2812559 RepID=UPI001A964747|nr:MotA/TolQ/ExbB proton channel family protein [Arenibaculum pallidiluteum]
MHHWLLWSRFAALNLVGIAGLFLVWINGWVDRIVQGDSSGISILIFALFVVGLVASAWRIDKVTRELDYLRVGQGGRLAAYRQSVVNNDRSTATRALELRLFSRIAFIRHIANTLVLLGLIGTVVGFVLALSGVSAEAVSDPTAVAGMVSQLISGMGVALYTTLVGSVLNLWLAANYQLLATGTANLAAALIDAGYANGPIPAGPGGGTYPADAHA